MSDDGGGDDEQMSNWRLQNCSCAINKCFYDCIIGTGIWWLWWNTLEICKMNDWWWELE